MSEERWKQIGELDYEVSSHGRVRRRSKPDSFLKPQQYVFVGLGRRRIPVHRLVAQAFLGRAPADKPWVNHKDGDPGNNEDGNLEWVDARENQLHAIETGLYRGRGEGAGRAKLTEAQVHEIRRRFSGRYGEQTRLAQEFGVTQGLIAKIVRGELWTHLADCPREPIPVPRDVAHGAKLSEEQVREVRERYTGGYGQQTVLAREYGVPVSVIRKVVHGQTWKRLRGTKFYVMPQGSKHGRSKLTDGQVRWMRQLYAKGVSIGKLAKRYGVTRPIARDVITGKTWKHVT